MKKVCLLLISVLLFSCLSKSFVIYDSFETIRLYVTEEYKILDMKFDEKTNRYYWNIYFTEKYTNENVPMILWLECISKEEIDIIEKNEYKIDLTVIVTLGSSVDIMAVFPRWIYIGKQSIENKEIFLYQKNHFGVDI